MGGAHYRDTSFVFPFQVAGQLKKLQSGSLYTTLNMIFTQVNFLFQGILHFLPCVTYSQ